MITYTEFFLFIALIVAIAHGFYWKHEAKKGFFVFKLIMTDPKAREEIIKDYNELKSKAG
jgi:hypothetical protein